MTPQFEADGKQRGHVPSSSHLEKLRGTGLADELVRLERSAHRFETRHHDGSIIWRSWGAGPPVLLFHGGSGSWNHWIRTIPALAMDHSVWAPDLPGMGESGLPATPITIEDYCALIAKGFEQVRGDRSRFDLVTFSMGGEFAVPFASQCADQVRSVTLAGSNIAFPLTRDHVPMRDYRKVEDPADRDRIIRENFRVVMLHDEEIIDDLALAMQHDNLRRRRLGSRSLLNHRPLCDVILELPAGIDLHVVNGTRDVVLGGRLAEQAEALSAVRPEGRFIAIEGGSHWVMYDRAEQFNEALDAILQGEP